MRLRKIKLSGFKSFVEPTTFIVPGNRVGVVGPNGCGKSNIVDAVSWVMGESSAKHLRGDALTDVIFNGSNSRQPVGQASVELLFDNSEGRAGGQYASYAEISIKRQLTREGVSTYTLNGTRCRRKDIQGLFLGTGLGPRSYSIIDQGMISHLVEAKPDELRVFIEEAAGISKYRERRRETENRIRHTRENLDRLNDIREELGKQLSHLQRQARAAERYQVLKQEERQAHAELQALNWRDLRAEIGRREERVRAQENKLEEGVAALRRIEADIEQQRDALSAANETFNRVQSDYYQVGGDISQLEQKIQHANERIAALETDLDKTRAAITECEQQQRHDQEQLQQLGSRTAALEPQLQGSRSESNAAYDALNQAEQAMQGWQNEWDALQESGAGFDRQIEVDNTRLEHLEAGLEELRYRRETLQQELEETDIDGFAGELQELETGLEQHNADISEQRSNLDSRREALRGSRDRVDQLNEQLAGLRSDQQKLAGRIASLESLQQSALGDDDSAVREWLVGVGAQQPQRLMERISIDEEWTHALETVLDARLQAFYIDNLDSVVAALDRLPAASLELATAGHAGGGAANRDWPRLLDRISTDLVLDGLLDGVYLAENTQQALARYPQLQANESVVTPDGLWLSRRWLRIRRREGEQDGILSREQSLKSLRGEEQALAQEIERCLENLETARRELEKAEEAQHQGQQVLSSRQEALADIQSRRSELKTRHEQAQHRIARIREELETLDDREEEDRRELDGIRQRLERVGADQQALAAERTRLSEQREQHRGLLENARTRWQETHEQSHEIALQLESLSSQRASLEQAIRRNEIQLGHHNGRFQELQQSLHEVQSPLPQWQETLQSRLDVRIETEQQLNRAREDMQGIEQNLRDAEQQRVAAEQSVTDLRSELEKLRYSAQEIRVRLQTVEEQLQADGHSAETLLQELDAEANQDAWKEKIAALERKISRLGPINLAAIDEFNQLSERKVYLDSQNEDLTGALTTLENAIRKIDKETRTRFKETFDRLNANLQETFPILFGGGHAYLEMTGDDLLETGVTIMARPPGKKNSTIHLLSGGEKALTAVALVFSIFKLNPAPFCILDEVDAPLDDTNTERFSRLLADMSTDVQFLFITHNKITMEIAQQLLGVTMHEAGVSRLVSVDMDEAVKMAASA